MVVGVDQSPEALVAARYALWQAEKRGLDLVVLHTYSIPAMEAPLSDAYFTCLREAAQAVVDKVLGRTGRTFGRPVKAFQAAGTA